MSPESVNYFDMADAHLQLAEGSFAAGLYQLTVKETYLVALSAARGIIFEKTGTAPKTHSGTHHLFSRLVHEGLPVEASFVQFLLDGFELKSDLDYGPVMPVQREFAEQAIVSARDFLAAARTVCT